MLVDDRGQLAEFLLRRSGQLRRKALEVSRRKGSVQRQRGDPVGISGGEQHAHGAALRHPQQGGALGARCVKYGVEVLHALLERRQARDRVR